MICGIIGCLFNRFSDVLLPWSIDNALICIIFFGMSYWLSEKLRKPLKVKAWKLSAVLIICILTVILCGGFNGLVDICYGDYGISYILFYLGGSAGSIMLCIISIALSLKFEMKILTALGKNTMTIYALHLVVYSFADVLIRLIGFGDSLILIPLVKIVLTLLILTPVTILFNKLIPFLVGRKRR